MKRLYVWENVAPVSFDYHNNGGVLIVTSGDPRDAWAAHVAELNSQATKWDDPITATGLDDKTPDHTFEVPDSTPDLVVVFPDAGCC